MRKTSSKTIWFDFENAPQVLVLKPLVRKLEEAGFSPLITARDFSMTLDLCRANDLDAVAIGAGSKGKGRFSKVIKVVERAVLLSQYVRRCAQLSPLLGISHGSRSQLLAGKLISTPVVILDDYEHSDQSLVRYAHSLLIPESISPSFWGKNSDKVIQYPGIKENLYLCTAKPVELPFRSEFPDKTLVLFRPEGRTTHYHSEMSALLQERILFKLAKRNDVVVLVYPRDNKQKKEIQAIFHGAPGSVVFPGIVDGPSLILSCDLVIGGGGTMTREAAALGVPSYSFFSGKWGGVDKHLVSKGHLIRIESKEDVDSIQLAKRQGPLSVPSCDTLDFVTAKLLNMVKELDDKG